QPRRRGEAHDVPLLHPVRHLDSRQGHHSGSRRGGPGACARGAPDRQRRAGARRSRRGRARRPRCPEDGPRLRTGLYPSRGHARARALKRSPLTADAGFPISCRAMLAWLIDLVLHLDRHLVELLVRYELWIYPILFAVIFAETGLVVTPFLPGDSLLFAVGALAAVDRSGTLQAPLAGV